MIAKLLTAFLALALALLIVRKVAALAERTRVRVRNEPRRQGRAVRNQAADPPDQAAARQQRRAILGHLDRDRSLAQRQCDDAPTAELKHAQLGAGDRAGFPGQRALEREHAVLCSRTHDQAHQGQHHRDGQAAEGECERGG